ncbi:hypothetical protein NPIL_19901 [Nephila pilipes]|uniref:C2H2-type domain-containing protein n=1 Tax=Nephila pilipes TaxID=299642 RepID=A0A8X6U3T1_NEPPI|nr:hypothetical protein NPIL_19901 [Nephila pilipes]
MFLFPIGFVKNESLPSKTTALGLTEIESLPLSATTVQGLVKNDLLAPIITTASELVENESLPLIAKTENKPMCKICYRVFTTRSVLKRHVKEVHYFVKNGYRCRLCCKSFSCKSDLVTHLEFSHLA